MDKSCLLRKAELYWRKTRPLFARGLKSLLVKNDEFEIVCEAEDGLEAIRCVSKYRPDLILLDPGECPG